MTDTEKRGTIRYCVQHFPYSISFHLKFFSHGSPVNLGGNHFQGAVGDTRTRCNK